MKRTTILYAIIALLVAFNVATIVTIIYRNDSNAAQIVADGEATPQNNMGKYFRDKLNLTPEQHQLSKTINQNYHRRAQGYATALEDLRLEYIAELGQASCDSLSIDRISTEIGQLHKNLKVETARYYRSMKEICTPDQQQELNRIFVTILNRDTPGKHNSRNQYQSGESGRRGNSNGNGNGRHNK